MNSVVPRTHLVVLLCPNTCFIYDVHAISDFPKELGPQAITMSIGRGQKGKAQIGSQ